MTRKCHNHIPDHGTRGRDKYRQPYDSKSYIEAKQSALYSLKHDDCRNRKGIQNYTKVPADDRTYRIYVYLAINALPLFICIYEGQSKITKS